MLQESTAKPRKVKIMADEKKYLGFELPEGEEITAETLDELSNGKGNDD